MLPVVTLLEFSGQSPKKLLSILQYRTVVAKIHIRQNSENLALRATTKAKIAVPTFPNRPGSDPRSIQTSELLTPTNPMADSKSLVPVADS